MAYFPLFFLTVATRNTITSHMNAEIPKLGKPVTLPGRFYCIQKAYSAAYKHNRKQASEVFIPTAQKYKSKHTEAANDRKNVANMAAASNPCSAVPDSFYENFGISQQVFQDAFNYRGDGTFELKSGWSLAFTHAVLTTGDRATNIAIKGQTGSAGELWSKCTGHSVTQEKCCVYNCPNPECSPHCCPLQARATAHVYCRSQTPKHDIRFMILIPTCSCCNHAGQAAKSQTNFPPTGEDAHILYTVTGARMIFIEVSAQTISNKGKGKGTGQGGGYKGDYPPGPPKGARIVR